MKKQLKALLSYGLTAAVLLGTLPADSLNVMAAESGHDAAYKQVLDKATTIRALKEGDAADLTVVNAGGWEHSPIGKALEITALGGEVRVHLPAFGDGMDAVRNVASVPDTDVTSGDGALAETVSSGNRLLTEPENSGNAGPADVIYEISMRTGEKLYGNLGFLARYKDENHYAGMTIDFANNSYTWGCQYSIENNARKNTTFSNSDDMSSLKANTDYLVELTCEGTTISCRIKEEGSGEYTDLGSQTMTEGVYYTGAGGLAVRLNPGSGTSVGGRSVMIDNIVQKSMDGQVLRTMDFEDGSVPEFKVYDNKGTVNRPDQVSLSVADVPAADEAEGFEKETVNRLTGTGGLFVDEASPEAAKGIFTVRTNGTNNNYGLVFHYRNADNYAAVRFDGSSWAVEGKNDGSSITGITLPVQPKALEANKAHTLVLDYSDLAKVTLKVDNNNDVELGDLSGVIPDSGKVGFVQGEAGTLYTSAIQLDYTEDLTGEFDPGLPDVVLEEGQDYYIQSMANGKSTLVNDGTAVPAITANQPPFGMEDKALSLKGEDDRRIKLTYFNDGPADGSYEFAFRTGSSVSFATVGFLARYIDESQYVGLSIDNGVWTLHAATSLSARQNDPFPNKYEALKADTTYKVIMGFVGNQVTVKVMKEGDAEYTDLGTLTSRGHLGGGAFAVRLRTAKTDFFMDNIVQIDASGNVVKSLDFNDGVVPEYEARFNKTENIVNTDAALEIREGYPTGEMVSGITPGPVSKVAAEQPGLYIDMASPAADLGTMTVQLKGSASKYGFVFNYVDDDNYASIEYNGSKWIAGGRNNAVPVEIDLSGMNIPAVEPENTRTFRLGRSADGFTLLVSGGPESSIEDYTSYDLGTLDGIHTGQGRMGVVVNEPMTLFAGPMELAYILEAMELPVPTTGVITLASGRMKAVVGDTFPHIYAYLDQNGEYLTGTGLIQGEEKTGMMILTKEGLNTCTTVSELKEQTEDSAVYLVTATGTGVEAKFTVILKAVENTLELKVTDVEQITGAVRTFAFEELQMVAIAGRGAGAAMGFANGWGPASDTFIDLRSASSDTTYGKMTYALFYDKTSGVVAAVENNAEKGTDKYVVKQNAAMPYLSASSTAWAWQYYDNTDPSHNLPYAKVVVAGDENQDGGITWQDAGIAYRDIMIKAYGSQDTKNEWMYIAMNMSSGASQPFLRVLDEAKAISYLTDGFGMKIMNKGYQGSGHDDSHGDYDFVGTQQGGTDDFNTLINEGLKYGIKNGVHINATEFALDGYETKLENLTKSGGELVGAWGWFDKAFHVDKTIDVAGGELERRLNEFETASPNLDFIYVDVYQSGSGYNATEFMRYMNENGLSVGTEALGDFNQLLNFVHWNTDLNYSTGGSQSEVLKFVVHGLGDLAAPDHALMGALMPGVADWRNVNDFNEGERVFYRNNLPTKYLQHFELLSWTPDVSAVLSQGVRTEVTEENGRTYTNIYKNEKLIAKTDTTGVKNYSEATGNPAAPSASEIFIPWSPEEEDKIYCYNDSNGSKSWNVPDSWNHVTEAYLYPLTENGRDTGNVKVVPVTDGKVQLALELSTPYILVKAAQDQAHRYNPDGKVMKENGETVLLPATEESEWGYGSRIQNFGFTGKTFEGWTKNAEEGNKEDIAIDTTIKGSKGNPRVVFPDGVTGSISQTVTVEPEQTYSFSAWTMAEGDRSPKLTIQAGAVTEEASVVTTNGIPVTIKPSKYNGLNYQRLKVDITIPQGVTQVTLTFSAQSGAKPVYVDDFRCWEWLTEPNAKAGEYYYFEDFENVDENWGPFISQVTNQPYIHLSYKNPEGGQIKYYTLDTYDENGQPDADNLTSLKGRQNGSYTNGIMMRTLPSTIDFKQGSSYRVELDHATYVEELDAVEGRHVGYNYPLDQPLYYMDVRSADGTVIESYPLDPSTFQEEGFNARPSTEKLSFVVDATQESGIYLTLRRDMSIYKEDADPAFAIDNVRVTVLEEENQYTVTFDTAPGEAEVEVKDGNGQIAVPQSGKTYILASGIYSYTVKAQGYITKTADFTVSEDVSVKVELEKEVVSPITYKVTFTTTPGDAAVKVTDAQGKEVQPMEGRIYRLEAGSYSYTVTAQGYVTKTADFTVSRETTIEVGLEKCQEDNDDTNDDGTNDDGTNDDNTTDDDTNDDDTNNDGSNNGSSNNSGLSQDIVTDWNQVKKNVSAASEDKSLSGSALNIVTGNNIEVPSDILKTLKERNMTLALHTGQGLAFSLTGSQVTKEAKKQKLNLNVRQGVSEIPGTVLGQKLQGTIANRKISLADTGNFGMNVTMHLSLGAENAGKYANLYRYDKKAGQLRYLGSFQITNNGQAMFGIRQGGEYLAAVTQKKSYEKVTAGIYTVVKGDTVSAIAARYGLKISEFMAANPQIQDRNKIRQGQQIMIR